ncbi:hypothetical protein NXS19_003396 [Fusarium pseudograminearum]|nr:hypothetical protein NXS19_003396 [Fusarium pseudograminearum]
MVSYDWRPDVAQMPQWLVDALSTRLNHSSGFNRSCTHFRKAGDAIRYFHCTLTSIITLLLTEILPSTSHLHDILPPLASRKQSIISKLTLHSILTHTQTLASECNDWS